MGPTHLFHIPSSLKRTRSAAVNTQKRPPDRRETKAEHILGITEADINTARNQSISSVATAKLQGNLSDATTEYGTPLSRDDKVPQLPELRLKASSVLLHEEYIRDPDTASSIRSSRLRRYDSSSTLHSHYDPSRAPLSISQQTSDSSRRDFALRKGAPSVVTSTAQEKDSMRQLKLFKSSNYKTDEGKKLSKYRPRPQNTTSHQSMASSRPTTGRRSPQESVTSVSVSSQVFKGVRHVPPQPSTASIASRSTRTKNSLLEPLDPACVKVNIRRPKVGAKHWFDGHEGDSSEEESIDEPAFEATFVDGVQSAFQSGRIKPPSDASTITTTATGSISGISTPKSVQFQSAKVQSNGNIPRIAALSTKVSKSSLKPPAQRPPAKLPPAKRPPAKRTADPLAKQDLNQQSVLNLISSSDDEDECVTPRRADSALSGPALRDSVAIAFNNESQVELGTAQAISAKPTGPDTSQVRKLKVVSQHDKRNQLHMPIPKRSSSRMLSYLSDQSEQNDLLASFPATPTESVPSHRTSVRSSAAFSDVASVESRRLMTVTRQEESLLAAMRLKKATMRYHKTRDIRLDTLRNLECGQSRTSQLSEGSTDGFESAPQLIINTRPVRESHSTVRRHRRSLSHDDGIQSRASGTTFQTTTSRNPSRLSRMTFQTEQSADSVTRLSLSSGGSQEPSASPSLLSLTTADRRQSRDTFLSSSSAGRPTHTRQLTATSHVVALDDLDKAPERHAISSQEFIDWPYKGWDARAELGLAH